MFGCERDISRKYTTKLDAAIRRKICPKKLLKPVKLIYKVKISSEAIKKDKYATKYTDLLFFMVGDLITHTKETHNTATITYSLTILKTDNPLPSI